MNKEFLQSLEKKTPDYQAIFKKLYKGVIETNKLIGIGLDDITEEQREALIETYFKLRIEEGKEVEEAIENEDRTNLVNELIDVLVVTGYEYYLEKGFSFAVYNEDEEWVPDSVPLEEDLFSVSYEAKIKNHGEDTILCVQDALAKMGCNLGKAVDEVLKANLSKFPTTVELAMCGYKWDATTNYDNVAEEQIKILEKGGRYSGVTCEKVIDSEGEERLVFWSEMEYGTPKRKYLKPVTFVKADLSDIWK